MESFQLGSQSRFLLSAWREEKFLTSAVDQLADAARHQNARALGHSRSSGRVRKDSGVAVAAHHHATATRGADGEASFSQIIHALVEGDWFGLVPAEKHSALIIRWLAWHSYSPSTRELPVRAPSSTTKPAAWVPCNRLRSPPAILSRAGPTRL